MTEFCDRQQRVGEFVARHVVQHVLANPAARAGRAAGEHVCRIDDRAAGQSAAAPLQSNRR